MSKRTTDGSDAIDLVASGSLGISYVSMSFENTASLGLSESISIVSESVAHVLNDTTSSYDYLHMERAIKFISAKMYNNRDAISTVYTEDQTVTGNRSFKAVITGSLSGSVEGNASSATTLETARTIGGTKFDGSADITPANATLAAKATILATARTIGGASFNGSKNIIPTGHKGSISLYPFSGTDFFPRSVSGQGELTPALLVGPNAVVVPAGNSFFANIILPIGLTPGEINLWGDTGKLFYKVYASLIPSSTYGTSKTKYVRIDNLKNGQSWNKAIAASDISAGIKLNLGKDWDSSEYMLTIAITTNDEMNPTLYGGTIQLT